MHVMNGHEHVQLGVLYWYCICTATTLHSSCLVKRLAIVIYGHNIRDAAVLSIGNGNIFTTVTGML